MRALSLIFVASSLLGCKDDQRSPAPPAPATATPAKAPSAPATAAEPPPRLTPAGAEGFDTEIEDKDWATNTERAITAVAPELADVDCRRTQCRATISAGTQEELVAKAEKLSSDEGIRSTEGARSVLLSAPETVNGKLTMKLYIEYDR